MRGMRLKFVAGLRLTVIYRLSPFPPPLTVTGQVDPTYPPTYPSYLGLLTLLAEGC